MKSRFVTDPQDPSQDPSHGFLDTAGAEVFTSFSPSPGHDLGNPSASAPAEIVATPSFFSSAAFSSAAASSTVSNSPGSAVAVTSGGITFNLLFDAAAMAAPAIFRVGIEDAASLLSAAIFDKITVNIKIDYSGTGGSAAAKPDTGYFEPYSSVRLDLLTNATPGDITFNALPSGGSVQGQSSVAVWNAQLKLWGLVGANDTTTDDGSATFTTDINPSLLVGVALHELTHALGRVPYGPPYASSPDIFDLFRFTSPGTQLITGGNTATPAYFSIDGGHTKLADFGQTSDASDFLNGGVQGPNDPFNEYYSGNTSQSLTAVDKQILDALGFHTSTIAQTIVNDNALSIPAGTTKTITSSMLSVSDSVTADTGLHFTVATAPTDGTLLLNGAATSSFTQADINNGLVSYHETATYVTSDNFHFTVTGATGTASFHVDINGSGAPSHAPSDFNGDGKDDILWYSDSGAVSIWDSGQISGAHWVSNPGVVPSSWQIVGTGDFAGTGHDAILWRDDNGAVSIWDNGQVSGAHIVTGPGIVPSSFHIVGTGDFSGNGHDDILWRNDNGAVSIWDSGQISGARSVAAAGVVPSSWHIAGIGDFDGNGHADILWQNDNGAVSIWDNGQIANAHIIANAGVVPSGWHIAGVGDFNGTGHADILWQNDNGAVSIWDNGQMTGAHWIANPGVVPSSWHIAGVGDFNGTGHADILWQNDNGAVSIWDNGQIANAHIIANAGAVAGSWHIA
jgi:hypothetical protein